MATIDDDTITSAPARKRAGGVQTISALPNYPVSTNANSGGPASMIKSAMSDDEINAYKAAASGNQGSHATSIADMPGMAPKNADAAYSQNGRSLGYGKTINGIATFSDGRSPGSIATMNPEMMQKLTASSAQPSNPNYGPEGGVTSAALGRGGLGGTLTQDQSLATRSIGSLPQGYDPSAAARNYQSDFASIVNKDPRSPLGIAARNAEVDRIWDRNTGPQQGHAGVVNRQLADEKYQRTIGGLDSLPRDVFNAESQAGIDSASNASRNSIASMEGLTSRNNAALNYNSPPRRLGRMLWATPRIRTQTPRDMPPTHAATQLETWRTPTPLDRVSMQRRKSGSETSSAKSA